MDNNTRNVMSWQEAQDILTEMFPPPKVVSMAHHQHHGGDFPFSDVTAIIWDGMPSANTTTLHHERAYDEHSNNDEGGWSTVVNRIRAQVEAKSCGE